MNTSIDSIIKTIQDLINQSEGLALDPEVNFSSMRATNNLNEADPKLYAKTGKYISVQREQKPLKLIVFLDINCNLKTWLNSERGAILDQIISSFSGEIIVEIRNSEDEHISGERREEVENYTNKKYESRIEHILEYAEAELQQGNIVIMVSDWLELEADSGQLTANSQNIISLQIKLPPLSSTYHLFYIKEFQKPNWNHRFEV